MKTKLTIKKVFQGALVIALALVFVALGNWQLDRSVIVKELNAAAKVIDPKIYSLGELAEPSVTLDSRNVNKSVALTGFYIANFKAPVQKDIDGQVSDWEVGLLQVGTNQGILVVKGLWSERLLNPDISMAMVIDIKGQLRASQSEDRAVNGDGAISRLDSSVIVGLTDLDLFDGYVMASSESRNGDEFTRQRLTPEKLSSRVSGYYWQHISYVVIWWLMAAVVLYLPFYRRSIKP